MKKISIPFPFLYRRVINEYDEPIVNAKVWTEYLHDCGDIETFFVETMNNGIYFSRVNLPCKIEIWAKGYENLSFEIKEEEDFEGEDVLISLDN